MRAQGVADRSAGWEPGLVAAGVTELFRCKVSVGVRVRLRVRAQGVADRSGGLGAVGVGWVGRRHRAVQVQVEGEAACFCCIRWVEGSGKGSGLQAGQLLLLVAYVLLLGLRAVLLRCIVVQTEALVRMIGMGASPEI